MSNLCNSLNIKTLKISQLRDHEAINSNDIFLVIESNENGLYSRKTTFSNIVNSLENYSISYKGDFTGNVSGNLNGSVTGSFLGNGLGSFTGSFTGSVTSHNFKGTGSFYANRFKGSGSFFGRNNIFNFKGSGRNVSFNGTSSYSVSSSYSDYALVAKSIASNDGSPVANVNEFAYFETGNELAGTNYLFRNPNLLNNTGIDPGDSIIPSAYFGSGRTVITKPLYFDNQSNPYFVGENLLFKSSSGQSVYSIGMQENSLYLRSDANFIIYHSGTFASNPFDGGPGNKNRFINPGKNGFTTLLSTQRLIGLGWFAKTNDVNAQCHIHLSSSKGYKANYNPNINAFLITSGSVSNRLLRVSGSGQLDVKGDIIALSTFASSDQRLKTEIHEIKNSNELIDKLNPVEFKWINTDLKDYGLIAQEVEQNYPELIKEDINGYKTVKYNSFIPILIKSIQDLRGEINELKEKIKKLE